MFKQFRSLSSVQYNYKNLEIHRITELHIDDANRADALAGSTILNQNGQILDTKLGESAIANVQALSKITKKLNGTKFIKWMIENHGKQTIIIL